MGIKKGKAPKEMGLKEFYLNLKEIIDKTKMCKKCGKCQAVCPVFKEIGSEGITSRGKLQLLGALDKNIFKNMAEVEKRLRFCLLCSKCIDACPQNIDTNVLFIKARLLMSEYDKKSFFKKLLIKLFIKLPKLSPFFLRSRRYSLATDDDKKDIKEKKVLFFSGCLFDKVYEEKIYKAKKIIKACGYQCEVVSNECCGIPLLTSGDETGFKNAKKSILNRFKEIDGHYLISGCPTCIHVIKDIWPSFDLETYHLNKKFEIIDFHGFLFKNLDKFNSKNITKNDKNLSWHQPCHLSSLGIDKEVFEIFKKFSNTDADLFVGEQKCCGFGGTFFLDHPLLSKKMAKKRGEDLNGNSGSIVTGCPACMGQLKRFSPDRFNKQGKKNKDIFHTIDIVFNCIKDI